MKNTMIWVTAVTLLVASCGDKPKDVLVIEREVPKEVPVPAKKMSQELAGYYSLPNGGFIEITALNDGRVKLESQQLLTLNKDKGLAYHPLFSAGPHVVTASGSIIYAQNLSYSNTINDLEKDGSTTDVTGVKRTELVIYKNEAGNLVVNLTVKDGTSIVDKIIISRSLESLK